MTTNVQLTKCVRALWSYENDLEVSDLSSSRLRQG